ncbi:MAG: hypothetical protein UY20_C0013G0003 [Candidatus Yanofskybacteria bacterium GW2011_GWA1_48_10]|uniref:Uncharacterized protein n=2 Tax=Candidatus Yanofskyibacteriota TaxID=1752733 RepID=A0A0G1U5L6_9BACT|nr:MAG: hypothetical protein UY20_C0013G0003 [Candidatus Yanofskybacteria bacterium GW2011_GWA1_48_10]OGN07472.1 MAG: hypothetical protein A2669_02020 [Candidatus Yanofskybacteria bacterium RIFCSPHIGHO2_01_FULL_48_25b]
MVFKIPKNDAKYHWTNHVVRKMMYYGLSPDRVKRIIRNPGRVEKGIAEDTIAVMQSAGTKSRPAEVWAMYALSKKARILSERSESKDDRSLGKLGTPTTAKKIIITAWRYPGISKVREEIPIPEDILEELKNIKY